MSDENPEKSSFHLTTAHKVGIAVAVAAAGIGGFYWWKNKKAAEEAAATPLPTKPEVEPIYALAPAVSVNIGQLPLMRALTDTAPASSYWVYGDELAPAVAAEIDKVLTPTTGNLQSHAAATADTTNLLTDLSVRLANHGLDGFPGGKGDDGIETPASDLWLITLGPKQTAVDPKLAKEYVTQARKALGTQRVLWVLAKSTPASIAKALNEGKEEFVRSSSDNPAYIAIDAANAAVAPSADLLAKAFPPPSATA